MPVIQEAMMMLNIYVLITNNRALKYYTTAKRNRQIHDYSQRFNTPLSRTCKISRQKIRKDMGGYRQLDLIDLYRTRHPTTVEHAFFSGMHRNFLPR